MNIYIENWQKKCAKMGLEIQDTTIYSMLFADDQLLLAQDNNNNNIYLLQLGCHPVAVVMLHVYKT